MSSINTGETMTGYVRPLRGELALPKDRFESLLLRVGEQMTVTASHFFGRMADPFVDHSLVDSLSCTVTAKRVTKGMPAAKVLESTSFERGPEMIVALVNRYFSSG